MNTLKITVSTLATAVMLLVATAAQSATYSEVILADKPVIYYTFSETGNTAINHGNGGRALNLKVSPGDSIINGNTRGPYHARYALGFAPDNATAYFAGKENSGISRVPFASAINGASALTVELWFAPDELLGIGNPNNDGQHLFRAATTTGTGAIAIQVSAQGIAIGGRSQTDDSFQRAFFSLDSINQTAPNIAVGKWTHLVAVYDYPDKSVGLYINGHFVGTQTVNFGNNTFNVGTPGADPSLGSYKPSFMGCIDEFAIYTRALTADQIQHHYASAISDPASWQTANSTIPWDEIYRTASDFVRGESPPEVWPFERPDHATLSASPRKIFPHFFTPFPLSHHNAPAHGDYYDRALMSPDGERGKHLDYGGYLRQRPLPIPQWKSRWWQQINLAVEILRAREIGVDGFAADILAIKPTGGTTTWERLLILMEVSSAVTPDFPVMLMPDMNGGLKKEPEQFVSLISNLSRFPSAYRLPDGRLVISTFKANAQPPAWWQANFATLEQQGTKVAFLPVFLGYHLIDQFARDYQSISYGMSDWGLRDITAAKNAGFDHVPKRVKAFTDVWMMPVAPQDMRPKNLMAWESENTRAFRWFWEAAIHNGSRYVQLITWNDYSEATEVSPSSGTQFLFYDLSAYYGAWFKTGTRPRVIRDAIYYCHRTQMVPPGEGPDPQKQKSPFQQRGGTPFKNDVELVAFLTAPATLEIEQNGRSVRQEIDAATLAANSGLVAFSARAETGRPVFRILRKNTEIVRQESAWTITGRVEIQDLLYVGGSSTRPFVTWK